MDVTAAVSCPSCQSGPMNPCQVPLRDVDRLGAVRCPGCQGTWLSAGVFRRIVGQADDQPPVPEHAMRAPRMSCPRCASTLFEFVPRGTQALVAGCRQCQGVWADSTAWPRLQSAPAVVSAGTLCPKCGVSQASNRSCEACGAIFTKVLEFEQQVHSALTSSPADAGSAFEPALGFQVRQRLEWLEILSPFETRNRYDVVFLGPRNTFGTVEESSRSLWNFIGRQFLGHVRPAELELRDEQGGLMLVMRKPLRLYFHALELRDASQRLLGTVRRVFHPLRPNYVVRDAKGRELFRVQGPLFMLPFFGQHFRFLRGSREVGQMAKRWRGILREWFSDADAFGARVDASLGWQDKALLFGAVFLIDFGNYESNEGE